MGGREGGREGSSVQCETSVRISVGAVPCVEVGAAAACALSVRPSGGQQEEKESQDTHEPDVYQQIGLLWFTSRLALMLCDVKIAPRLCFRA